MIQGWLKDAAVTLSVSRVQIFRRLSLPDRAPYPTRMRVILTLSILSWLMVALVIAWA